MLPVTARGPVSPKVLCIRLRAIMGAQKITRTKLAQMTGISRPSLGNKLDGNVPFTYDELVAIITALGISWRVLLAPGSADEETWRN